MQLFYLMNQIHLNDLQSAIIVATETSTTSTSVSTLSNIVQVISDFGVEVVITAVTICFMYRYMRNLIKRDNGLYENVIPKIEGLSTSIKSMESDINKLISNHNTHSNTMLRNLEKDQEDLHDMVLENQNQLRELNARLTSLQRNQEIMFRMIATMKSYDMQKTVSGGQVIDFAQSEDPDEFGEEVNSSENSEPQTKK
jgi:SMC interacting uncharacterized protein involved in chromosome segregation